MQKVLLPGTALTVSRLCMGTANFGTALSEEQAHRHLNLFAAHGGAISRKLHPTQKDQFMLY